MADTIQKGITITFRGDTAEFDKGVSKINGELKSLKDETKLLNKELKLDPNNFDKLSQKLTNLKSQEKLLKEELDAYNQAMAQMDKNSKEFENTEKKARNLQIQLGYVTKEIDKLGGNQVSLALNTLGKQFDDVGSKISGLGQKFSGLSAAASGLLAGFGKLSYDVVKSADDINTLAKQTGLSTDTLQVFGQMADLVDVDLNTLSKSALNLTKNIDTKNAQENYKKLGVSIKDLDGNYRKTEDILFDTIKALQKVDDETERSLIANDLFGKSYSQLGSILNDTSVDLEKIRTQVEENGVILSQDELNKLNAVNDNIDTFKMTLSGMGTTLVSEFQEPLKNVTDKLVILANKVKEFMGSLSTEQKERILTIIGIVAGIAPLLLIVGSAISTIGTILGALGTIVSTITTIWGAFNAILSANPIGVVIIVVGALIAVIALLVKHWDEVKQKVMEVWEQFKQTEFVQTLIEWFDLLIEKVQAVVEWFRNLFDWVGNVISKVGEFFSSGIEKVVGWFSSGGFGNAGAYASGGYGTLELNTTINVNNNGSNLSPLDAQQFGRQIVEYVNDKLGRRI